MAHHLPRRDFLKLATALAAGAASVHAADALPAPRISYYHNGEIHVARLGDPDGTPLTTGHFDFKPSWSKTGDRLVCFRRTRNDPVTANWKSAIFIINIDGSGLHLLSDGTRTDFNPTWSRDGRNTPIWNRRNPTGAGYHVMQSAIGAKPGQETPLTDDSFHTWAHSCLTDGRILVNSVHPTLGRGLFLLSRARDGKPLYEAVRCELNATGQLHRASISPGETKICFEFLLGNTFTEPGHTLYIADFDAAARAITNLKPFANEARKPIWYAYPRWIGNESAVVYHSAQTGKNQLYLYRLSDHSTTRISSTPTADYRYPHGESSPC